MTLKKGLTFAMLCLSLLPVSIFAQKKATVNWFGYIRSAYQLNIPAEGDMTGQFKLFPTLIGLTANINEYSSIFLDGYFNQQMLFHVDTSETEYRYVFALLDAQVNFKPLKNLTLSAGQFVTPFSTENLLSASKTDFINRGYVAAYSVPYRDIGAFINYRSERLDLYATVANGSGINKADNNDYKNIILRADGNPIGGLRIAASASIGYDDLPDALAEKQNCYDASISYRYKGLYLIGEGSYSDYMNRETTTFYGYVLYDIPINAKMLHYITPAFRYDFLDFTGEKNRTDRFTFGIGLNFDKDKWLSLFRLNYELIKSETGDPADALIFEMQMRFE